MKISARVEDSFYILPLHVTSPNILMWKRLQSTSVLDSEGILACHYVLCLHPNMCGYRHGVWCHTHNYCKSLSRCLETLMTLDTTLPTFHQFVDCPTVCMLMWVKLRVSPPCPYWENQTIIMSSWRPTTCPVSWVSLLLYCTIHAFWKWSEEKLKDWFECTDWSML